MKQNGQAAIEFILVLPFLFIFFYGVLEFSQLFIQQQRVSALSREIANSAFRSCSSLSGTQLTGCLDVTLAQVKIGAVNILPGFNTRGGTLIASIYRPGGGGVTTAALRTSGGGASTKYSTGSFGATFVTDQGAVGVGEVFYPYQPLFTALKKLLPSIGYPTTLYESTVL